MQSNSIFQIPATAPNSTITKPATRLLVVDYGGVLLLILIIG